MKRIHALLIFTFISFSIKAQYQPIASNDSTYWVVTEEVPDAIYTTRIDLADAVTIDTMVYHELRYVSQQLAGYFREDTVAGKTWFMSAEDSSEYLIMDLSLTVGDSITVVLHEQSVTMQATSVSQWNGGKRIIFDHEYYSPYTPTPQANQQYFQFIEGVGPTASLLYPEFGEWGLGFSLCRMFQDTTFIYEWDPVEGRCHYSDGLSVDEKASVTRFYPNPCKNYLVLSDKDNRVVITTIEGKKMPFTKEGNRIDVSRLPKGIYFLQLDDHMTKFVKE